MADALIDWQAAGNVLDSGGEIFGQIGVAGMGSIVRIPVPGTGGLAIEFSPRGWTPKGGSTSSLFIQDVAGKRMLRLDYGYNKSTGTVDFHWNQKGVADKFGITNHTPAGRVGQAIDKGARYFKWGGRVLLIAGAIADGYSVVTSDQPWRQVAVVTGGWTGAWAGCKAGGAFGALAGTAAAPGAGTAVGGVAGCFAGGLGGYWLGKTLVTEIVDSQAAATVGRVVEELLGPPSDAMNGSSSDNAGWSACSRSIGIYVP